MTRTYLPSENSIFRKAAQNPSQRKARLGQASPNSSESLQNRYQVLPEKKRLHCQDHHKGSKSRGKEDLLQQE